MQASQHYISQHCLCFLWKKTVKEQLVFDTLWTAALCNAFWVAHGAHHHWDRWCACLPSCSSSQSALDCQVFGAFLPARGVILVGKEIKIFSWSFFMGMRLRKCHCSTITNRNLKVPPILGSSFLSRASAFVLALWHAVHKVCRFSRPHSPPPRHTGTTWSACHKEPSVTLEGDLISGASSWKATQILQVQEKIIPARDPKQCLKDCSWNSWKSVIT